MNSEKAPPQKAPLTILSYILVASCVILVWLGWSLWALYLDNKTTVEERLRATHLSGVIMHLDEVLTMSARMAAATGDLRWEKRYRRFEPQLNTAIKETMGLVPEAPGAKTAAKTNAANIKLVEMENRAFDLVRRGHVGEAEGILFSDEYKKQKDIYAEGMRELVSRLFSATTAQLQRLKLSALVATASATVGLVLLITGGILVVRAGRTWEASLEKKNIELGRRAVDLRREVSERKRAQEQWRLMQFATDHAADAAFWMDSNARFFYVNEAACRSLGYSRDELLSMTVHDIDPEFPANRWPRHWRDLKENGSLTFKSVHQTKDGTIFTVEIAANYLEFNGNEYNCAFARDISQREWTEEHRKLLSLLVEQSSEGLAVINFSGDTLFVNRAFAAMHGYEPLELIGKPVAVFHSPEQIESLEAANRQVQESGEFSGEIWHAKRDGSVFPALMHNSLLRDESGAPLGIILAMKDVAERKRAEELGLRNAILSGQSELSPDGVLVVDEQGNIASFNQRFVAMWGIPDEVVQSRSDERALESVLHKLVDPNAFLSRVRYLYEHREERSKDEIHLLDNRVFERYSAPIFGPDREYLGRVWYFRDITDHSRAEEALKASEERYRELVETANGVIL